MREFRFVVPEYELSQTKAKAINSALERVKRVPRLDFLYEPYFFSSHEKVHFDEVFKKMKTLRDQRYPKTSLSFKKERFDEGVLWYEKPQKKRAD